MFCLKIKKYLITIDERKNLLFAPKGKWSAVQLVENQKVKFDQEDKADAELGILRAADAIEAFIENNDFNQTGNQFNG